MVVVRERWVDLNVGLGVGLLCSGESGFDGEGECGWSLVQGRPKVSSTEGWQAIYHQLVVLSGKKIHTIISGTYLWKLVYFRYFLPDFSVQFFPLEADWDFF